MPTDRCLLYTVNTIGDRGGHSRKGGRYPLPYTNCSYKYRARSSLDFNRANRLSSICVTAGHASVSISLHVAFVYLSDDECTYGPFFHQQYLSELAIKQISPQTLCEVLPPRC